jgi:nucleoid-associated protein YgaU
VTYERFTPDGKPIAAKATLRFNACSLPPTRTNPTSGGLPGRRAHTLVAGENLQHVAVANYGRPGAWRALAAANGVENPLAVRPGTAIYIPALAELEEGSRE